MIVKDRYSVLAPGGFGDSRSLSIFEVSVDPRCEPLCGRVRLSMTYQDDLLETACEEVGLHNVSIFVGRTCP